MIRKCSKYPPQVPKDYLILTFSILFLLSTLTVFYQMILLNMSFSSHHEPQQQTFAQVASDGRTIKVIGQENDFEGDNGSVKTMLLNYRQYIVIPDARKWNLGEFTFQIWLKLLNTPRTGSEACILSHGDYSGRFKMSILNDKRIRITFKFAHGTVIDHDSCVLNIIEGQWHHVALTYRTSTSESVLYLDGVMQDQKFYGGQDNPLAETDLDARVGRCHSGSPLDGYIYSIKVHYQAHSFTQIRKDVINYDHFDELRDDVVAHYIFVDDPSLEKSTDVVIKFLNQRELPVTSQNVRYHGEVIGPGYLTDQVIDIGKIVGSAGLLSTPVITELRSYDSLWNRKYSISIIIPYTHHLSYLTECLQVLLDTTSIFYNNHPDILNEIIIVETQFGTMPRGFNGLVSKKPGPTITVLHHKESMPMTISAAINHGISHSSAEDYIIVVDDSAVPVQGWLEELILIMEEHSKVAIAGSRLLYPSGLIFSAGLEYHLISPDYKKKVPAPFYRYRGHKNENILQEERQVVDAIPYQSMIIRRNVFGNIGPLNESISIDLAISDLCFRAKEIDSLTVLVSRSIVYLSSPPLPHNKPMDIKSSMAVVNPKQQDMITKKITSQYQNKDVSVLWIMHCGGSMGFEAANLLYGLEKVLDIRASNRNHRQCEHTDTLSQLPISFQETLDRLVEHTRPANKTEIIVYHRDYREIGRWVPHNADYVIGRYMFETDGLPLPWVINCNKLDEIWVPASVFVESFSKSGVDRNKIFVIPEALDMRFYNPDQTLPLNTLASRKKGYTFVSVFKLEERKGWRNLIRAYFEEFSTPTDYYKVTLAIRTYIYNDPDAHNKKKILKFLLSYAAEIGVLNHKYQPHIEVIAEHLPASAMPSLYKAADAFVLPTHGEGWGLPIMEAMAMGLPAIATGWGGNMEFMNKDNSFPIDVEGMIPTSSTDEWIKGFRWAQPSIRHLKELMRQCVDDPQFCAKRGQAGRQYIANNYSVEKVASLIDDRIQAIRNKLHSKNYMLTHSTPVRDFDVTHGLSGEFIECARRRKPIIQLSVDANSNRLRSKKRIAIVSTYPPTKCGIGTFTWDLVNSGFRTMGDVVDVEIIAMVKNDKEYNDRNMFDRKVTRRVREWVQRDYDAAAMYINESGFDFVIIEHEFGIFKGGPCGAYIVCFARALSVPSIVTIHTVKKKLTEEEHAILQQMFLIAKNVIVMTNTMKKILDTYHNIYGDKIVVMPHGVRNTPFPDRAIEKARIKIDSKMRTIVGFGLIHPGKGYEHVIRAMPMILKEHPATLFLIYGKPHPNCNPPCVDYVNKLKDMVREMRLGKHVIFDGSFLTDDQVDRVLGATDIYITPYTDTEQSVSGTVALAMSKGCVVASSPYYYVNEVLADGAGVIFDNLSAKTIATTVVQLLKDNVKLNEMSNIAYEMTRTWVWEKIAERHIELFES